MFRYRRAALPVSLTSGFLLAFISKTNEARNETGNETGINGAIGNTPLVYLRSLSEETGCKIYGKAEFMNPTGSVKVYHTIDNDNPWENST